MRWRVRRRCRHRSTEEEKEDKKKTTGEYGEWKEAKRGENWDGQEKRNGNEITNLAA